MKNSEYLKKILDAMKKYHTGELPLNTCEGFILSVLDSVCENNRLKTSDKYESEEEAEVVEEIRGLGIDIERFRNILSESSAPTTAGAMFFRMLMIDAIKSASDNSREEMSVMDVLNCIIAEPTAVIKDAFMKAAVANLPETEEFAAEETDFSDGVTQKLINLTNKANDLQKALSEEVKGQDKAIEAFINGYFQSEQLFLTEKKHSGPKASFLFAGPPGVGKTALAMNVAEQLGVKFERFDMSEYCDHEASVEFLGSDKVYTHGKKGNFTEFIEKNPRCLVLFDEIEKAHITIIHQFLQILDSGEIRDNYTDQKLSLSEAILIFTTNAGKQLYNNSETEDFSRLPKKVILNALKKDVNPVTHNPYFPEAICSRFSSGNVIMFNHLKANSLLEIIKRDFQKQIMNFKTKTGISFSVDENVYSSLMFAEGGAADARSVLGRSKSFFNTELYELFRLMNSESNSHEISNVRKIKICADVPDNKEIKQLYTSREKINTLIFTDKETAEKCEKNSRGVHFIDADKVEDAVEILRVTEINFILLDMTIGVRNDEGCLNIEDVKSESRDFLNKILESYSNIPVFIIYGKNSGFSDEEKRSFRSKGIRDFICFDTGEFQKSITAVGKTIHQQRSMDRLAKTRKAVSFETSQSVSEDGKTVEIKLFDFRLDAAIDAEDTGTLVSNISRPDITFKKVIGAEDAKSELEYFVNYLKDPSSFLKKGAKQPRGVILYGPPGTGKTMLAKAMANESGVTFIAAEGNQFLKRFIGEGPEAVHELFRTARKYAPSILFVDEIDAIAKERKGGDSSAEDILTAFLAEMDGFTVNDPSRPVFVLAATNFNVNPGSAKSLDPALMRRFDRRIYVDLPRKYERLKFMNEKIKANPIFKISKAKIESLCIRSTGMSLAELDSVFELALRTVIRTDKDNVTDEVLDEAFETFNGGTQRKWSDNLLERTARHEAGHALLCWLNGETPAYLTIVARGGHGGYMQHSTDEGKALFTRNELLAKIRVSLGGRAAEIVCYGEEDGLSTGASGDLYNATWYAQNIVCNYGMESSVGLAVIDRETANRGAVSQQVREAVNAILDAEMENAVKIIRDNREKLDALVKNLLQSNQMTAQEIEKVLGASHK